MTKKDEQGLTKLTLEVKNWNHQSRKLQFRKRTFGPWVLRENPVSQLPVHLI